MNRGAGDWVSVSQSVAMVSGGLRNSQTEDLLCSVLSAGVDAGVIRVSNGNVLATMSCCLGSPPNGMGPRFTKDGSGRAALASRSAWSWSTCTPIAEPKRMSMATISTPIDAILMAKGLFSTSLRGKTNTLEVWCRVVRPWD